MLRRTEDLFARMRSAMKSMGGSPRMLSPDAAAKALGVSSRQFEGLAKSGSISVMWFAGQRAVPFSEIRRLRRH